MLEYMYTFLFLLLWTSFVVVNYSCRIRCWLLYQQKKGKEPERKNTFVRGQNRKSDLFVKSLSLFEVQQKLYLNESKSHMKKQEFKIICHVKNYWEEIFYMFFDKFLLACFTVKMDLFSTIYNLKHSALILQNYK